MSRSRCARAFTTAPCTLPGIASATVPGRSEYGKHVEVRERRRRRGSPRGRRGRRRSRRETRRSRRNRSRRAGSRAAHVVDQRRERAAEYRADAWPAASPSAGVLQRQVEVRGEARRARGHHIEHRRRAVHRFERADAHTEVPGRRASAASSVGERVAVAQITAPGAEMHAGERDLLVAGVDDAASSSSTSARRAAAARPACRRDDAVAARLVAAGLRAQRPRGAAHQPGPGRAAARPVAAGSSAASAAAWRTSRGLSPFGTTVDDARQRRDLARAREA